MRLFFLVSIVLFIGISCVPEKRVVGVYGTPYGDTMRVVEDHSWRIELEEPDTAGQKQFKYTTGRWHKKGRKLRLNVDSKSYGDYWECVPFHISWSKLRRPMACSGGGKNYVFHRVNFKKINRVTRREAKRGEKREKTEAREKIEARIREAEDEK